MVWAFWKADDMICARCGVTNSAQSRFCGRCGQPMAGFQPPPASERIEDNFWARMALPVGRSGLAIVAGYFGLLSLLLVPAPFAILFGWLALRDLKVHPGMLGKGRAIFAIVMGVLGTGGLVYVITAAGSCSGGT